MSEDLPLGWPNPGTRQPVRAYLDGDGCSMKTAKRLFDDSDLRIAKLDGKWALLAHDLDLRWGAGTALHEKAQQLIRRINGTVRVEEPRHQPILLTGSYRGQLGEQFHVRFLRRSYEGDPPASFAPSASGAEYLDQASRVPELAEVLHFMGGPEPLTTLDMWKVFEIIRTHVGGKNKKKATERLLATGWITEYQLDRFNEVIHNPHVSGDAARHAVHVESKEPEIFHQSMSWARITTARLVREWRKTL